jgi:hypothetical protein
LIFASKNAVSEIDGSGGITAVGAVTVTLVSARALPPGPFARAEYVVEAEGLTVRLPVASTVPIPLSMFTLVALDVLQVIVADSPF